MVLFRSEASSKLRFLVACARCHSSTIWRKGMGETRSDTEGYNLALT